MPKPESKSFRKSRFSKITINVPVVYMGQAAVQGRTQGGCTGCTCIPPSPLCIPPRPCASPPPQPERLVMRKDEAVGNKKKMQVCLPKHNYKLDNNLLTVEPRAVYPHCFDADPEPDPDLAQNLDADADRIQIRGGEGVGQPKMCIPPGKIPGTPLLIPLFFSLPSTFKHTRNERFSNWILNSRS
jgi:hypothetical protein